MNLAEPRRLFLLLAREPRRLPGVLRERPALMLFTANVLAQSISVLCAPLLARLYSPHDFGVLGAFNAVVMMGLPLVSLRYELAIPQARSDRAAFATLCVCGLSIVLTSALSCLGISLLLAHHQGAWLDSLRAVAYFIPLATCASALYDVLAMEAGRRGALGTLARSKLSQAGLGVAVQVILGVLKQGTLGLMLGFLVNQAAGITRLCLQLVVHHPAAGRIGLRELKASAHEHRNYALYTSWSSALEIAGRWAVQFAITVLWDPRVGGFIFLADRVIGRPLTMLSTSLLPVFISDFGRAVHSAPERLAPIFFATLRRQALLSLAWTLGVVVLAPFVFGPLFGPSWQGSVAYVQIMSLAIAPTTTLSPVGYTLQLLGRQRMESLMSASKIGLVILSLAACYWLHTSALVALGSFAVVQLVHALLRFAIYARTVTAMSSAPPPQPEPAAAGPQSVHPTPLLEN
jgi:O-antigen/teichoic acid export membrane protein